MKIFFLDHEYRLGGAELMLLRFLQKCDRERVQGELVLTREGPFAEMAGASGIPVHLLPLGGDVGSYRRGPSLPGVADASALLAAAGTLRRIIRSIRPDCVVSNTMKAHVYGTLATKWTGIPYAWRLHDIVDEREFSYAQRFLMRMCARIGPVSIAGVSAAVCKPFTGQNTQVIYNGVEKPAMASADAIEGFRRENRLGAEVVAIVGRMMPAKGHRVFLETVRRLARLRPAASYLIVGDEFGSEGFGEELRRTAAEAGVSDRVRFLPFQKNLSSVYGCSSVVVVPSITPESLPTVILEAMSYGVPVVASRIGGATEIVDDGVNGRLFPPGDSAVCASSILGILSDHTTRDRFREGGLLTVGERFSLSAYVGGMTAWLEGVARAGDDGRRNAG